MARSSQLELRVSEAGRLATVAAQLWGERGSLARDLNEFFPLFMAFASTASRSSDRYPDGDGVVIRRDGPHGFPTFPALNRAIAGITSASQQPRAVVDRLVELGAMRRGLILACPECALVQFTRPQSVDFAATCSRCGGQVRLNQVSWRSPADEPNWFYDLHPVLRRLLHDNGDVPLLAEAYLSRRVRRLTGVPEFELHGPSGLDCEIDLLCASEDTVIVGEAKTTPSIPPDQQKKKIRALVLAARTFRADEVVLAAGAEGDWDSTLVEKLSIALERDSRPHGSTPSIRLLSGLRTHSPTDIVIP
jgi:hypothetical protein